MFDFVTNLWPGAQRAPANLPPAHPPERSIDDRWKVAGTSLARKRKASGKRPAKKRQPSPPLDGVDAVILALIAACRASGPWRLLSVTELADAMACSVGEASKRVKQAADVEGLVWAHRTSTGVRHVSRGMHVPSDVFDLVRFGRSEGAAGAVVKHKAASLGAPPLSWGIKLARKVGEIDKSTLNRYVSPPTREKSRGTPMPERRAKELDGFDAKVVTAGNIHREPEISHKTREPVDVYRKHFTAEEVMAAEQFCRDAHAPFFAATTTSQYDGMPRSSPGPRSGGVADRNHEAYGRFRKVLESVTPGDRKALLALVLSLRSEITGRGTTIHELARDRGASYTDQASLAKVGLGLLKAALEHTYEAYRDARCPRPAPPGARALPQKPRSR
jgi:hypothetical protein